MVSNSGSVFGIYLSGGTTINIYQNKVYKLTSFTTSTSQSAGMYLGTGSTATNVYNNVIGQINVPAGGQTGATTYSAMGIQAAGTSGTLQIYGNTVYLDGGSGGPFAYNTACISQSNYGNNACNGFAKQHPNR